MKEYTAVKLEIVAECSEDYVGLWSIIKRIKAAGAVVPPDTLMDVTLQVLRELLSTDNIVAGQFLDNTFHVWRRAPLEVVSKVKQEWIALGKDPSIGEVVWLTRDTS